MKKIIKFKIFVSALMGIIQKKGVYNKPQIVEIDYNIRFLGAHFKDTP